MNTQIATTQRSSAMQLAKAVEPIALLSSVPATIQRAAQLAQGEALQARFLGAEDLADSLLEPLTGVAFLIGHSNTLKEATDLNMMADEVALLVLRRFPAFRVPEICEALRRGASNEWPMGDGSFVACSLPFIGHWLQSYQNAARAEALRLLKLEQEKQQDQLQLPAYDIERDYPEKVAELAQELTTNGIPQVLDVAHIAYDWLSRIGALNGWRTQAQYEAMRDEEAEKLLPKQLPFDRDQRREFVTFADALERGQWPKGHPLEPTVVSNCKRRILVEWLIEQVAKRVDLRSMLEQLAEKARERSAAA